MRLLVCGSHTAVDASKVHAVLDKFTPIPDLVICGGAPGVDSFADSWARGRGIPLMIMPAPWNSWRGRGAGPARNGWMLRFGQPDLVLAFPGGSGTADMVKQATRMKVKVQHV